MRKSLNHGNNVAPYDGVVGQVDRVEPMLLVDACAIAILRKTDILIENISLHVDMQFSMEIKAKGYSITICIQLTILTNLISAAMQYYTSAYTLQLH